MDSADSLRQRAGLGFRGAAKSGLLPVVALLAAVGMVACGGGGSGSPSSSTPAVAPASPIPLPTISFGGATTAAVITEESAGPLATASWFALDAVDSLADGLTDVTLAPGAFTRTEACAGGGNKAIESRASSGGIGAYIIDFTQCVEDAIRFSGRMVIEVTAVFPGGQTSSASIHLYGTLIEDLAAGGSASRLTGTLSRTVAPQLAAGVVPAWRITGDLLVVDPATSSETRYSGIEMQWALAPLLTSATLAVGGRVFAGARGYVDLVTLSPLHLMQASLSSVSGSIFPDSGGPLKMLGAASRSVFLGPLSRNYLALGLDLTGNGKLERSRVVPWRSSLSAASRPGLSPEAVGFAGDPSSAGVLLDGRYSDGGDTRFVSGGWTIVSSPIGSHPTLGNSDQLVTTLATTAPGDYLLRLEVSDGTRTARDFVSLTVTAQSLASPPATAEYNYAVVGPDAQVQPGAFLTLDSGRSRVGQSLVPQYLWTIPAASEWFALSGNPTTPTVLMTAPSRGRTTVTLAFAAAAGRSASKYLITAPALRFVREPTRLLDQQGSDPLATLVTADINADGRTDILLGKEAQLGSTLATELIVAENIGLANFGSRVVATPSFTAIRAGAYGGDARPDLYLITPQGLSVMTQASNGTFSVSTSANRTTTCVGASTFSPHPVELIDMNADALADVVTVSPCQSRVEIWLRQPNGSFIFSSPNIDAFHFAALDLNGDGCGDIVTSGGGNLGDDLLFHRSNCSGGFATTQDFSDTVSATALVRADLNGDSRDDFVIRAGFGVHLFVVQPNGSLTRTILNLPLASAAGVGVADMDGDGRPDIWAGNDVFLQTVSGFSATSSQTLHAISDRMGLHALADLDGDGRADMVASSLSAEVRLYLQSVWDGA